MQLIWQLLTSTAKADHHGHVKVGNLSVLLYGDIVLGKSYTQRRRLLEWLAERLLIARLPVRIPPKAREYL